MTEIIQKKLSDSKAARWTALAIVAFSMLCGYFLTDVMSPLKPMLESELLWSSTDFGFFTSAYGWFNVFFLMLIFGGMILDKMGVRFTGLGSCLLMVIGCALKYAAIAGYIGSDGVILGWKAQVVFASVGYAIFGVGVETAGITVSKIIVKWFKGKEMALAMGLEMATARIGTMLAMAVTVPFAKYFQSVSAPVLLCLIMLCIGTISFMVYTVMDRKLEASMGDAEEEEEEEPFRVSDVLLIVKNKGFWLIATIMVFGAVMLIGVHLLFASPLLNVWWFATIIMIILGIAFSLVPSAMWPSVPKIIPEKQLGTAYALIFWVQNWGLMGVPALIGWVLDKYCKLDNSNGGPAYDYTLPMIIFMCFGILALGVALLLKREDKIKGYGLELPNIKK